MCWDILKTDGLNAKRAVEIGAVTMALENVVEINTYLSGIGFEKRRFGRGAWYPKRIHSGPETARGAAQ